MTFEEWWNQETEGSDGYGLEMCYELVRDSWYYQQSVIDKQSEYIKILEANCPQAGKK